MLILILVDIQYLPNVVFSFKKCSNGITPHQNPTHQIKNSPTAKFPILTGESFPLAVMVEISRERGGGGGRKNIKYGG